MHDRRSVYHRSVSQPLTAAELAALARVRVEDVEQYVKRGLLDIDGDGILDELDVLRLRILVHYRGVGYSLDELEEAIRARSRGILYVDLLFATDAEALTPEQVAEHSGLDAGDVNALRRAIGLSGPIPSEDLKFFEVAKGLVDGGVPFKVLLDLARVYGDTLRRLAQSEVRMIRSFVTEPGRSTVLKDRAQSERLQAVQELIGPILEPLLLNIHRQHLLRASVQEALADVEAAERGEDRDSLEAAIVFVDLASFTPLAQVHGDEVAADVLDRFDELVRELLEAHSGTLVKQIGDAFMLTFSDPADATRFVVDLDEAAVREPNFPAIRAGINAGPVLYRVGDYVGNTVNVASRIAAIAKAHEILMTQGVAKAAEAAGLPLEHAGERRLAGVEEPQALWRIARVGERATRRERDPVCGMAVGEDAVAHLAYGGYEYAFCSHACLRKFLEDPTRYVEPNEREKPEL